MPFRLYAYLAIFAAVSVFIVSALGYSYNRGKASCEVRILKETITIKEKQNEVRNNRPDSKQLIDSLMRGEF